jgi:LacI family transcriptional regulator
MLQPPRRRPIRLQDVAHRAGVSVATASLVLTGAAKARIKDATRALVQRAAQDLGYVPNRLARGLVRGRTQTIGVIIPDLSNAFYAGIVDGIEAACDEAGMRVLLAHGRGQAAFEAHQAQLLLAQQVDGLVVVIADGPPDGTRDWMQPMVGNGVACVVIDEADLRLAVDTVTSDDQAGLALAVAPPGAPGPSPDRPDPGG